MTKLTDAPHCRQSKQQTEQKKKKKKKVPKWSMHARCSNEAEARKSCISASVGESRTRDFRFLCKSHESTAVEASAALR